MQRAEAQQQDPLLGAALARHHLQRVADGLEPAYAAVQSCASAMSDAPVPPITSRLGSFARGGIALRDALRVGAQLQAAKVERWNVLIPCRVSRTSDDAVHEVVHPTYMPHEILHALYKAKPDSFQRMMPGQRGIAGLNTFWEKSAAHDWARMHPALNEIGRRPCIPLVLHGDDVQFKKTGHESIAVISVHAEVGDATTSLSRYLVAAVPLAWKTTSTLQPVFLH